MLSGKMTSSICQCTCKSNYVRSKGGYSDDYFNIIGFSDEKYDKLVNKVFTESSKGAVVAADFYGKLKTVCQMVCIIFVLINNFPFEAFNIQFTTILVWFTALISLFSGYNYYRQVKPYIFASF